MARTYSHESKVHRVLFKNASGGPQKGSDVKELQRAVNTRLASRGIKFTHLKVDGVYGPKTHESALRALYYLGITRASVGMKSKNPTGLSHGAQEFIRLEKARNKWQLARSKARVAAYTKSHKKLRITVMYDDINLDLIPSSAPAVAGYTSGRWPTYPELAHRFPHAKRLSIAVTAAHDADCLDVEPGDATISQAPHWVLRQHERGVKRPVVYCALSQAASLVATLSRAGIKRSSYRLWTAHYTGHAHRCDSLCGFSMPGTADATQWTDHAHGVSLDQSLLSPTFF